MDQHTAELKLRLEAIERRLANLEALALLAAASGSDAATDAQAPQQGQNAGDRTGDNSGHVSQLAAAGPERSRRQRAALR